MNGWVKIDTFNIKARKVGIDSLKLNPNISGSLDFDSPFYIGANTPLVALDSAKVSMMNSDSLLVDFSMKLNAVSNQIDFEFEREPEQKYDLTLLPGAVTDFFDTENDTLNYSLSTKSFSDFGNVNLKLEGAVAYPLIVQLTDDKGEVKREIYTTEEQILEFKNINPATYLIRVIFDENSNGKWDTGAYLTKLQPERVSYYPGILEVRANWDLEQTFTITE